MLKILLAFSIAVWTLQAGMVVQESADRRVVYEKAPAAAAKSVAPLQRGTRYFIDGDPAQERHSTGRVIVGFESDVDAAAFAQRWQLENPRRISRLFVTWVFDNRSALDDAALASRIAAEEPLIRFAKPEWTSVRISK
ncbi:MAG: hypothetical protein AB7E49_01185 [Campylobacterales bacterium]